MQSPATHSHSPYTPATLNNYKWPAICSFTHPYRYYVVLASIFFFVHLLHFVNSHRLPANSNTASFVNTQAELATFTASGHVVVKLFAHLFVSHIRQQASEGYDFDFSNFRYHDS